MQTQISKLTLQGFKSFNRKISIPLLNGFNVICGPNGAGKSNICDAICFVLGRISAKSLRADKLHELIFRGNDGRSNADYASVSLFLDNSKKMFPFDDEEVNITRKVNRGGVSIYKLNGRTTTREKILQVLGSARIFPDGHNIVLQGDITEIIEMNDVGRRSFIDEISGISEYNDKKEKAGRDLESVNQKLKEAEIIITQRFDIFKKLETERNAALKFQTLQNQLTLLKASYAWKKFQTLDEAVKKIGDDLQKKEEINGQLNQEIEKVEAVLENREQSVKNVAAELVDLSKKIQVDKEVTELRTNLMLTKDRLDFNIRESERLSSMISRLQAFESRVEESRDSIPLAVRTILRQHLKGVHGRIMDLVQVPEKYRTAMEIAAASHKNDMVVEDEHVASFCIDFLKSEKIGRATFLPLNKVRPTLFRDNEFLNWEGVDGVCSELIKYDTKFMSAVEFVFGNTLIVKNLEVAKSIGVGKARMVTLDGDLVERSGAMTGGYFIKLHPKSIESTSGKELEGYIEEKTRVSEQIGLLQEAIVEMEGKLKKYSKLENTSEIINLEKLRISSDQEIDQVRNKRKKFFERRIELQQEINKLKIEGARKEAEIENAKIDLAQYGEMKYVDEKLTVLDENIKKTFRELTSLGAINMKAIDEFDKFRNEFDEYKKKYEKILEEKKAVLGMIEKIEEKRKEVFYKTLNELSKHFNDVYRRMTRGEASLVLENPNDLESGLIIQANPEGKNVVNIDGMSGGEKTLTALAFLFAIQKYKPAPFYILDEIDAALDKENTRKVAEVIKSFSKDAQFIVITHNDQTIKYGDSVFGCTMDRGETRILGLELPKL